MNELERRMLLQENVASIEKLHGDSRSQQTSLLDSSPTEGRSARTTERLEPVGYLGKGLTHAYISFQCSALGCARRALHLSYYPFHSPQERCGREVTQLLVFGPLPLLSGQEAAHAFGYPVSHTM
eukprot:TRINITY_DN3368_c0_g2_i2.p1 TRINITY_DN3368_c0_g2~~TRINITY_DN3368_c0_g2_i2.p1  ORF type:complete len:125 (+),score=11.31 TRINITY_DN3368_c0_g2_i2:94-468(+)